MGLYEDRVLPRVIDLTLGSRQLDRFRAEVLADTRGVVLEVGFGSGTNLAHYPSTVTTVLGAEPSRRARELAATRIEDFGGSVDFVELDGDRLVVDDEVADCVVSTWTLCTIPNAALALREIARVLRPGGRLHFLEHGLDHDAAVARRQQRWDGVQQRIAGGCHLNRDHGSLIEASPLELESVVNFRLAGPKTLGYMYRGVARKLLV